MRQRRAETIDHCKAYDDRYWRNNKPLVYAKNARRACLTPPYPSWADHEKSTHMYQMRHEASDYGHQVPSITLCRSARRSFAGYIGKRTFKSSRESENSKKHNSYWPDIP